MRKIGFLVLLVSCSAIAYELGKTDQEVKNLPFNVSGINMAYIHTTKGSKLHNWYQDKLGLKMGWGDSNWQDFEMPQNSSSFGIDFNKGGSPVQDQSIILSFTVDDIATAVTHMQANGVVFLNPSSPIEKREFGLLASFQDGDGNWMQIVQLPANK